MNRRHLIQILAATPLLSALGQGPMRSAGAAQNATPVAVGSLTFDPEAFTVETKTATTAAGDVEVTYRLYSAIPYVANPVDVTYQSLNVLVPVALDGTDIDASGAPILFENNIGGYISSSVTGVSSGGMGEGGGPPAGLSDGGTPPAGMSGGPGGGSSEGSISAFDDGRVNNSDLALANGFVVVNPGARGRDNVTDDGVFYGKAPVAIVDLKAAVRYLRANAGIIPGNTDWIVSSGTSAGGALSTLLGASGDSEGYAEYLTEIGAADASDAIFAVAAYCPITDLDHADMAYEWTFGPVATQGGALVDQTVSAELASMFTGYQASLNLIDPTGNPITADNYADYLSETFLVPAASTYLTALSDDDRAAYLAENTWVAWADNAVAIDFSGFQQHVGRKKDAPAFDAFDLSAGENNLFGNETTDNRHFTLYSLRHATADETAELDADLPPVIDLMNPMHFLGQANPNRAKNWFLRVGTVDSDTSPVILANLAAAAESLGDGLDARMYWDAGHGANQDADTFMEWISTITGYSAA